MDENELKQASRQAGMFSEVYTATVQLFQIMLKGTYFNIDNDKLCITDQFVVQAGLHFSLTTIKG